MIKSIEFNEFGVCTQSKQDVISALGNSNDILMFGDTKHSNPRCKQAVYEMLPNLKLAAYGMLWFEIDNAKNEKFNQFRAGNPSSEEVVGWFTDEIKLKSKAVFAEGANIAIASDMELGFIDNKKPVNDFRKSHPDFADIQAKFNENKKAGMLILAAEEKALEGLSEAQITDYRAAKLEWQALRDGVNIDWAERVIEAANRHAKQIIVCGDGHFNALDDMDDILAEKGKSVATIHVCVDLATFGEYLALYIDKEPEDKSPRKIPNLVYVDDKKLFLDPSNEKIQQLARKAYEMKEKGVPYDVALPTKSAGMGRE